MLSRYKWHCSPLEKVRFGEKFQKHVVRLGSLSFVINKEKEKQTNKTLSRESYIDWELSCLPGIQILL